MGVGGQHGRKVGVVLKKQHKHPNRCTIQNTGYQGAPIIRYFNSIKIPRQK